MTDQPTHARVFAVSINWRSAAATIESVRALLKAGALAETQVVLIDNGSGDGSAEALAQAFPHATLFALQHNTGFGPAANRGIQHALAQQADAVLLLNSDAVIADDAIVRMMQRLHDDPSVGVVSAKIFLQEVQPPRLWKVGGVWQNNNVISLGEGELDRGQYDAAQLDFVYGCAMLLRADLLRQIGGFDNQFFLYYEDVDLCLRAQAAGYRSVIEPSAHVWHAGSYSTRGQSALKIRHEMTSRMQFFRKHLHGSAWQRFFWRECRYAASQVLRATARGRLGEAWAYAQGRWLGLTHFGATSNNMA